jgi:hypothetical protein
MAAQNSLSRQRDPISNNTHMKLTSSSITTAIFSWLFFAITLPVTSDGQTQTKKLLTDWMRLPNAHDAVGVEKLCVDDCELIYPNREDIQKSSAAVRQVYSRYFNGTPDP